VIIAAVDWTPFALPLRAPAPGQAEAQRHGFLIHASDEQGHRGTGEISPLPGWHDEALSDVEVALPAVAQALVGQELADLEQVGRALAGVPGGPMSSVTFGVEMAWLGLRAQALGSVPARVLCPNPAARVPLSELFAGGGESATRMAPTRPVVKVKVGDRALAEDRATLKHLITQHPTTRWRIDGNRKLTTSAAIDLLDGVDLSRIDYFEEPLRDPAELTALHEVTGVDLAIDETLREERAAELRGAPGVTTWVCKPALHGGIAAARRLGAEAAEAKIDVVISSCFESGLGLWALTQLAACVQRPGTAAGLGTDRWIAEDVIDPPFEAQTSHASIDDWIGEVTT